MSDNRKARLDADRTAKPLTEIRAHHRAGDCILPGINARAYTVRETAFQVRESPPGTHEPGKVCASYANVRDALLNCNHDTHSVWCVRHGCWVGNCGCDSPY